jgi:hypothetical protein
VPDAVQVRTILATTPDYSQRALDDLAANGHAIDDADIERLPPPGTDQITLTGPLPDRAPSPPLLSVGAGTRNLATAFQISPPDYAELFELFLAPLQRSRRPLGITRDSA